MVKFNVENQDFKQKARKVEDLADKPLVDVRFRHLLSQKDWSALPKAVKDRFTARVQGGQSKVYTGNITRNNMTFWGRTLAQVLRLFGAPLPLERHNIGNPAVVTVTEDTHGQGQFWIRQYDRAKGFPQTIKSAKRFAGPTGLEEHIGYGIGMTLRLAVRGSALYFIKDRYFVQYFGARLYLPDWATPGELTITHVDKGEGQFEFGLRLQHKVLGELIHQTILFHDART